jgi:hypothetical protein
MRFETLHMRSLYRPGSLKTVNRKLTNYRLALVEVQGFKWEKGDDELARDFTFLNGKGN